MAFIDDMETEGIPERILQLMRALELDTMLDICRRIKLAAEITRTADYQLERMRQLSAFKANYEKMIKRVLDLSDEQLQKLYEEVIPKGYARDQKLYQAAGADWVPFEENETLQQLIKAVSKQTRDTLQNITQTTGFYNLNGNRCEPLTQYFINILDKTHLEISTGVFSYDQALNKAVSDMAMSGMRWINYDNPGKKPWHNRVDVAARRAVMTGIVQVEGQIADDNAEKLDTEYFEVSAHATARPTHMVWQGRVYTKQQLIDICGLGTGPGLLGWNCYHHYDAFIPGISVRKYTDDQLADMRKKALETKEWKGKRYTIYEATQRQRQLETAMRACNEKIAMLKEGGASRDSITAQTIRRNDLYKEYRDFSKEFGLPEQINRVYTGINAKRFSGNGLTISSGHGPDARGVSDSINGFTKRESTPAISITSEVITQKINNAVEIVRNDPTISRNEITKMFPEKTMIGINPYSGNNVIVRNKDFSYFITKHVNDGALDANDILNIANVLSYNIIARTDNDAGYIFIRKAENKDGYYDAVLKQTEDGDEIFHYLYRGAKNGKKFINKLRRMKRIIDEKDE